MNTCVQSYVLSPAEQELGSKASDSLYFLHNPLDTETVVSLTRTGNISCFLYLEKDQDMLRGCDQGFMTGASDSLG